MSLEQTDAESRAVAKNDNRIRLAFIESQIASRFDFSGDEIRTHVKPAPGHDGLRFGFPYNPLEKLCVCFLVMQNGFVVIGKSAPLDPDNFNAELGKKFAYEDAIRQLWPLYAFARLEDAQRGDQPMETLHPGDKVVR